MGGILQEGWREGFGRCRPSKSTEDIDVCEGEGYTSTPSRSGEHVDMKRFGHGRISTGKGCRLPGRSSNRPVTS